MAGVGGVHDDVACSAHTVLDVSDCREPFASDALSGFYHFLEGLPFGHSGAAVPHCHTVGQYALDGASVEVCENLRRQMFLL